jgi:hypothetical protein
MALNLGGPFADIASNPFAGLALNAVVPGAGTVMNTVAGGAAAAGGGAAAGGAAADGTGIFSKLLSSGLGKGISNLASGINKDSAGMLSMGMGAVKNLQANIQQRKANAMFPSNEDPELRMLANDFRRRKRAFQTGTAMTAELANQRALAKQGQNAAFRAGGGSAGLNRMQQMLGQAMLGNKEAGLKGEMFYAEKFGDVTNTLAQTRLQKALAKYSQANATATQTKTDANRMTNLGLMRTMGLGPDGKPLAAPTDTTTTVEETTTTPTTSAFNPAFTPGDVSSATQLSSNVGLNSGNVNMYTPKNDFYNTTNVLQGFK